MVFVRVSPLLSLHDEQRLSHSFMLCTHPPPPLPPLHSITCSAPAGEPAHRWWLTCLFVLIVLATAYYWTR